MDQEVKIFQEISTPRESLDFSQVTGGLGLGGPAAPLQPTSKDALFDLADPAFSTDHFRVYEFKVRVYIDYTLHSHSSSSFESD